MKGGASKLNVTQNGYEMPRHVLLVYLAGTKITVCFPHLFICMSTLMTCLRIIPYYMYVAMVYE